MTGAPSPWWDKERHKDRRPYLVARGRIVSAVRRYFHDRDFIEVECGALQVSPGNEAHLHAMRADVTGPDGTSAPFFLHTSPEFACKKLLAAGETRIFDLARVFRNRERGPLHASEFTMLEWYRAHEPYGQVMADAVALLSIAAQAEGCEWLAFEGRTCDPNRAPERLTVAEAFARHAGMDLLSTIDPAGAGNRDALAGLAVSAGVRVTDDDSWSDVFSRVLRAKVEPHLGLERATLLDEYPRAEAALARPCPHDPRVAERFELYACGVELANGFGELTDAGEQRRRFASEMTEKERVYGERYPIDEDFLAALDQMPPASGVALGLDRLVMLATNARRIDDVTWTPAP